MGMSLSGMSLSGRAGQLRRVVHYARLFARHEREQYPGALHPSMWRRGFLSNRLYAYPGINDPGATFISDLRIETRLHAVNGRSAQTVLRDKLAFVDALAARGLATSSPEVYGVIVGGTYRPRSSEAQQHMRAQDSVVLKPVDGRGGRGVQLVRGDQVEQLQPPDGAELLVQERIRQHRTLAAINPTSLNTVRLLSVRLRHDGPVVVAAVHRWGTAASGLVDNVSSGGLCSWVDLETGRLGPAVGRPRGRHRVELHEHPDTGQRITGVLVPEWPEVRELTARLMDAFPEADHVGWDLCVSDRGPLIVEGNGGAANLNVFQFHGPFLQDERVRQFYVQHHLLPSAPA